MPRKSYLIGCTLIAALGGERCLVHDADGNPRRVGSDEMTAAIDAARGRTTSGFLRGGSRSIRDARTRCPCS